MPSTRPTSRRRRATLYEHCARALDLAIKRTGASGLPLILGGDWNDGMNRVGEDGKGESVWLGWFLVKTLRDFLPFAKAAGDKPRADAWRKHAKTLKKALEAAGWDGEWYRRGSYDDGTPLGSRSLRRVPDRRDRAVVERAVGRGRPGARADGDALGNTHAGRRRTQDHQAVHAALRQDRAGSRLHQELSARRARKWRAIYACARPGSCLRWPSSGSPTRPGAASACSTRSTTRSTATAAERYRVEPYVVAADVYSVGALAGRGGWTWYTGSAGWLYRAAVEAILGIRKQGNTIL